MNNYSLTINGSNLCPKSTRGIYPTAHGYSDGTSPGLWVDANQHTHPPRALKGPTEVNWEVAVST